jgi:hypothetical protein
VKPQRLLVHITRVADGVTAMVDDGVYPRTYPARGARPEVTADRGLAEFYWMDGNGACDCSLGEHMGDGDDLPCGSEAYDIRLEWADSGISAERLATGSVSVGMPPGHELLGVFDGKARVMQPNGSYVEVEAT